MTLLEHGIEILTPANRGKHVQGGVITEIQFQELESDKFIFSTTPHSENSLVNMYSSVFNHNSQIGCALYM